MTLSSSSTRAEVLAAYADSASYDENQSLAQARSFVSACRLLLSPKFSVKRSAHGGDGQEVELDLQMTKELMNSAIAWIDANQHLASSGNSSGVIHADFTGFRE